MKFLSPVYARAAMWRRAWYARHPEARRRLASPVISVGNLAVGGSGKTPIVATLARWLISRGERPAILTRGYARRRGNDGVVVVSDRERVLVPVAASGDEPQMLARSLRGVPVLVSADRYLAGCLAERRFGASVHVLDDGFQHFALERDVDLLLVSPEDLEDSVLPGGRLREPLSAARAAHALLVHGTDEEAAAVSARLGVARWFRVLTTYGAARVLEPFGALMPPMSGMRALAVAGIARPRRFFDAARRHGWDIVQELPFRDHHWFDAADLTRMLAIARAAKADVILTTEKDAMRLLNLPLAPIPRTFAYLPMTVAIEPAAGFYDWLAAAMQPGPDVGAGFSRPGPDVAAGPDVGAGFSRPDNHA